LRRRELSILDESPGRTRNAKTGKRKSFKKRGGVPKEKEIFFKLGHGKSLSAE